MCIIPKYVANTQFEDEGVQAIRNSSNWDERVNSFNNSCMLCSLNCERNDCEGCPIRAELLSNVKWHGIPQDYQWITEEMALA